MARSVFHKGKRYGLVVVSEGRGADWLAEQGRNEPALRLLPYQPYDRLPEVLASADVLIAVLEPEAGAFSVPSKILTYLCAATGIARGMLWAGVAITLFFVVLAVFAPLIAPYVFNQYRDNGVRFSQLAPLIRGERLLGLRAS